MPRPFSEFPLVAAQYVRQLRQFLEVANLLDSGCISLREVSRKLPLACQCGRSPGSLSQLETKLTVLINLRFGCVVRLYRRAGSGTPVLGLSEHGHSFLQAAKEYLDELDRQSSRG